MRQHTSLYACTIEARKAEARDILNGTWAHETLRVVAARFMRQHGESQ